MAENKVTVYVGGRRFNLVSSESEEYVKKIAKNVNDRLGVIAKTYSQLDARGCAVMAALDFADDEQRALGKKAELVHQANKILHQADKHSKQIIELKKQNSALEQEKDELNAQIEELKKANSNLTRQYNELKKFLDRQINESRQKQPGMNVKNSVETKPADSDKNKTDKPENVQKPAQNNTGKVQINHGTKPKTEEQPTAPAEDGGGYTPMRQYSLFDDEN